MRQRKDLDRLLENAVAAALDLPLPHTLAPNRKLARGAHRHSARKRMLPAATGPARHAARA